MGFVEIGVDRVGDIARAMGADGDRAAGRFARGCRCFAIESSGEIIAFGWLSMGREWIGELSAWITPAEGEGYVWNCFTLEPHRRFGNYRRLLRGFVSLPGLRRLWIGSIEDPAEKADADTGFVPVLNVEVRMLAGLRRLTIHPDPRADPGLVDDARRRVGLTSWNSLGRVRRRIH